MSYYASYESNGEIFCIVECEPGAVDVSGMIEVSPEVSDDTHYIDMSQTVYHARERRKFDITPHVDDLTVTLANVPNETVVSVEGSDMDVSDGVAEIEFDVPGIYAIELRHVQYLDKTLEVTLE